MKLRLPAPAKLNLFLHVLGRRGDGYHDLQTLFQLLDFGDTVQIEDSPSGAIELLTAIPGIATADHLAYRAAAALRAHSGCDKGVVISLEKQLPVGAGLGGGSSDAATTLLALNRLWGLGMNLDELAAIGLTLGADVPVFVHGHSAWAEGIGERLQAVSLPTRWYLVVFPQCQVQTAKVFAHEELTRNDQPITIRAFLEAGGHNSCQPVVEKLYPAVKEARLWLQEYAPARMTGTGSSLFASFDCESAAEEILRQLPGRWRGFVARGVDTSPAHAALEDL